MCVVAWLRKEPVNIRWAFLGSVFLPYVSRRLILAPDEFYFDEAYTDPRYRRRGIDIMTLRFMLALFQRRGYQRPSCLLASWEIKRPRRFESLGMKRNGEIGYRIGFSGKHHFIKGGFVDLGRGRVALAAEGAKAK